MLSSIPVGAVCEDSPVLSLKLCYVCIACDHFLFWSTTCLTEEAIPSLLLLSDTAKKKKFHFKVTACMPLNVQFTFFVKHWYEEAHNGSGFFFQCYFSLVRNTCITKEIFPHLIVKNSFNL